MTVGVAGRLDDGGPVHHRPIGERCDWSVRRYDGYVSGACEHVGFSCRRQNVVERANMIAMPMGRDYIANIGHSSSMLDYRSRDCLEAPRISSVDDDEPVSALNDVGRYASERNAVGRNVGGHGFGC